MSQPAVAPGRVPSLDGLRAISISLVLFQHVFRTPGFPFRGRIPELALGEFGVRVFFVISGFLITGLLLHEHKKSGTIALKKFYFRRSLRIFPVYYTYILVIVLLGLAGAITLRTHELLPALTYTMNYHIAAYHAAGTPVYLRHCWSLAVEEQFYLLWPFMLRALGTRLAPRVALVYYVAATFIAYALYRYDPDGLSDRVAQFQLAAPPIALGCLLACHRAQLEALGWYRRALASPAFVLVPIAGVAAWVMRGPHPLADIFVFENVTNISVALVIHWAITFHRDRLSRKST
jgi:peptidoglycan/LPS O-acetylase OafA/YrhL